MSLRIDGMLVQTPTSLKLGRFTISKAQRAVSGRMMIEIIAVKRRLDCEWALISAPALKQIHDLLETGTVHTIQFVDTRTGETSTMQAYTGDRAQTLWPNLHGERQWKDASIALIEI